MEYIPHSSAGTIQLYYEGTALDTLALGTLEVQLHEIAEKVAMQTLVEGKGGLFNLLVPPHKKPAYLHSWRLIRRRWPKIADSLLSEIIRFGGEDLQTPFEDVPLVRLRTDGIRSGSIYHDLSLYVAECISSSHVHAVLQSFGGNLLYAIAESGLRGIEFIKRTKNASEEQKRPPTFDPYDVGDNVRSIVSEIIANGDGNVSSLTIRHKFKDGQDEVVIRIK